jgi:translation initiation factor 2 alpha subunit (eIF-2alpha)
MAWQQADVDAVRAAITKLAIGDREVSISYAGPPARSVTYHETDLKSLRELLAQMESDLQRAAGAPTYRLGATRKGL